MILKFDDYIKEGFLSKTYNRYKTGEERFEDKHKYKTSLGVDVKINCLNDDVEEIIETILNSESNEEDGLNYNTDSGDMIVGDDGEDDVYITFPDYSNVIEDYYDDVSEEDYSTILDSIGTAIKNNVGKYTDIIPTRTSYGYAVLLNQRIMDEIGEDGWTTYKNMLDNWVNQHDKYQTSHGFDLGEWSDWTIYLNYDAIKDFPKIYENIKKCLEKWREEYNKDDEDWEEE